MRVMQRKPWLACMAAIVLTACQHPTLLATPATLMTPVQAACLKQMQTVIAQDLPQGQSLVLTDAAFATSDLLRISPSDLADAQGRLMQGRMRGLPESYRLRKDHNQCFILREQTMQSTRLDACSCKAWPQP